MLSIEQQEMVYEFYGVELYTTISSPLPEREDTNPSFSTKILGDNVKWADFGAGLVGKSCYDFVMEMEGCDFKASLEKVKGIVSGVEKSSNTPFKTSRSRLLAPKIEVMSTKNWEKWELAYWAMRGINQDQLENSLTYPLRVLKVDGKFKATSMMNNPKFVYYLGGVMGESLKVYSPYDTLFKWLSNRLDLVDYETPPQGKYKDLIILSSRKDNLVFNNYKLPFDTTSSLSESNFNGIIKQLDKDFKDYDNIYALFDFDDKGVEFSYMLSQQSGFRIKPIIFGGVMNFLHSVGVKDIDNLRMRGDLELEKIILDEIRGQTIKK